MYETAASNGHAMAEYHLALMHAYGDRPGHAQDLPRALTLFQKGGPLNHGGSCFNLGRMTMYGQGTPVDYDVARYWFSRAIAGVEIKFIAWRCRLASMAWRSTWQSRTIAPENLISTQAIATNDVAIGDVARTPSRSWKRASRDASDFEDWLFASLIALIAARIVVWKSVVKTTPFKPPPVGVRPANRVSPHCACATRFLD